MIDIKLIRDSVKKVKEGLKKKGIDTKIVDEVLKLDKEWRELVTAVDGQRNKQKKLGEKREFKKAKLIKVKIQALGKKLDKINEERRKLLENIPNLPSDEVPIGKDENDNVIVREVGKKTTLKFEIESLDVIDTKRAAKVSGSRFGYLKGGAALLEVALISFAFEKLVKEGFIPVFPPVMIKPKVMREMGKGRFIDDGDAFYIEKDDLYLVGSAEHTLGPLHKDEIFEENALPKRYVGFSTAFRREAGSYGKDTKGILRVHQFDKVEMFSFCRPEDSEKELQYLVSMQEKLVKALKLPYRLVEICTGDLGWTDARQYDIETWLPSEKRYRETHSASNTTDFQARGVNVRMRRKKSQQIEFVHMLNATGLAMGRTIISILENYQTKDGNVKTPAILKSHFKNGFIVKNSSK